MTDETFLDALAGRLHGLPGIEGVALGGSRAQGVARPDSDWDLGLYYRGTFEPQDLRDLGWEGTVSEIGGWGGGLFNGGGWLRIEGRAVDVHYRDLDAVEAEVERAGRGEFAIDPLMFHLAGYPTYLVVAELAVNRVLRGVVPSVTSYPEELRRRAPGVWADRAEMTLSYAESTHAAQGRALQCLGLVSVGASYYAHAVQASRGQWATNEKRLLSDAGLSAVQQWAVEVDATPEALTGLVGRVRDLARPLLTSP